jgi:hypothetical protein
MSAEMQREMVMGRRELEVHYREARCLSSMVRCGDVRMHVERSITVRPGA